MQIKIFRFSQELKYFFFRRGSPHPQDEDPMTLSTMSTFSEESDLDTSGELKKTFSNEIMVNLCFVKPRVLLRNIDIWSKVKLYFT